MIAILWRMIKSQRLHHAFAMGNKQFQTTIAIHIGYCRTST